MKIFCNQVNNIVMAVYMRAAALALLVLVVSAFVQVVGRYIFNASPGWSEELARYAFIWSSALGAACALDRGGHAAITAFVDRASPRSKKILTAAMTAVAAAVSLIIAKEGWNLAAATTRMFSPVMKIPMLYINISICFCGAGMFISSLNSLMQLYAKK